MIEATKFVNVVLVDGRIPCCCVMNGEVWNLLHQKQLLLTLCLFQLKNPIVFPEKSHDQYDFLMPCSTVSFIGDFLS